MVTAERIKEIRAEKDVSLQEARRIALMEKLDRDLAIAAAESAIEQRINSLVDAVKTIRELLLR